MKRQPTHPLDDCTAEAITDYLAYRHRSWPSNTNPYPLVSRNTATTTAAVGAFWMDRLLKELPVGVDRLPQDRILEKPWPMVPIHCTSRPDPAPWPGAPIRHRGLVRRTRVPAGVGAQRT
ncbi:hypothetical protein ACIRQP_40900, partial [Streptomyces sp. NPDC102274]|uniref:hypothetical protein n=1 Tax=Streptomyces sp. NPDC102274 TaxID=3366151 RepID=UPI003823755D